MDAYFAAIERLCETLFKGEEYVRHSFGETIDSGYPKIIANVWSGWPSASIKTSPLAFYGVPNKEQGLKLDGHPKMHNKTMLFSKLHFNNPPIIDENQWPSSMEYVVVESSANIWKSQYSQANQLILSYGHRELYEDALRRFKNILHRKIDADKFPVFSPRDKSYTMFKNRDIKVYGFPRKTDLIVSILNNISSHFEAPPNKQPHIRMITSGFTRKEIASKLIDLKEMHNEKLIIEIAASNIRPEIAEILCQNNNPLIDVLKIDPSGDNIKIHSKVLIYEGQYFINGKSQWCKLVWCGSHNYTYSALSKHSETLWRIWNDDVYDAHVENFAALFTALTGFDC